MPRKKALKPPGYKPKLKLKSKPKPKPKAEDDDEYVEEEGEEEEYMEEDGEGTPATKPVKPPREPVMYVVPTLRRSTVTKVAEARRERQYKEKVSAAVVSRLIEWDDCFSTIACVHALVSRYTQNF